LNSLLANQKSRVAEDVALQIQNGSMPHRNTLLIHPDAILTAAEK
jgi:hypothetical protein